MDAMRLKQVSLKYCHTYITVRENIEQIGREQNNAIVLEEKSASFVKLLVRTKVCQIFLNDLDQIIHRQMTHEALKICDPTKEIAHGCIAALTVELSPQELHIEQLGLSRPAGIVISLKLCSVGITSNR